MSFCLRHPVKMLSCVLIMLFAVTPNLSAQTHVVSLADIHKEILNATQTRQQNLEKMTQFLASEAAQRALTSAPIDAAQVHTAVSTLSDAELAQLATRMDKVQDDFAAGRLTDRDLMLILLGVLVLILIILAVK
jgi:hypothetical protein